MGKGHIFFGNRTNKRWHCSSWEGKKGRSEEYPALLIGLPLRCGLASVRVFF